MKKVYILGAGASHGAGFNSYRKIKPPLLKDFFKTFSAFNYFSNSETQVKDFFDFLEKSIGLKKCDLEKGAPDLEKVIDIIDEFLNEKMSAWHISDNNLDNFQELFRLHEYKNFLIELIADALHRTTWQENGLTPPKCPYHELIAKQLKQNDIVINLNYDLIMDMALINNKWNWPTGYGLSFKYIYQNYETEWEEFNTKNNNQIHYLKLHGSLNWFNTMSGEETLHLINPELWYEKKGLRSKQFSALPDKRLIQSIIIGPGRKRNYQALNPLWLNAEKELKDTKKVYIVGCSFREHDVHLLKLLKENIEWNSLDTFVIVDPKEKIKDNIEKYFRKSTEYFISIEKFADYLKKQ